MGKTKLKRKRGKQIYKRQYICEMREMKNIITKWNSISLVKRIICGLIIGLILGLVVPQATPIAMLGQLFVGALKAIAPILVFFLVMSALLPYGKGQKTNMKTVILLYLLGNSICACSRTGCCQLLIPDYADTHRDSVESMTAPPSGIGEVLSNLLINIVANPVGSIVNANYIGILAWAVIFGLALKKASDGTKKALENISDAVSQAVRWVINCAPFGIMGLIFNTISEQGLSVLLGYGRLILVIVGCVFFVALVVNPIIVFICYRKNPYPLVLKCLKDSGITAFFTRSSAANIPVNMELCED